MGPTLALGLLAALAAVGCGERTPQTFTSVVGPNGDGVPALVAPSDPSEPGASPDGEDRGDVLLQVLQLIGTAATNIGGDNFTQAAESLNIYFQQVPRDAYVPPLPVQQYLAAQNLPPDAPQRLGNTQFVGQFDGRHIEDCLMYRSVANAVLTRAGVAPDDAMGRARVLFDWVVRNVILVPPGTLAKLGPDGQPLQAQARPYDVLLRGMATESGTWAERSWAFLALCRQVGLEGGLLTVVPPAPGVGVLKPGEALPNRVTTFACGILIDGEVYLFDAQLGLPIPGPGGRGVATFAQALEDPAVLAQLDLPDRPYAVQARDLQEGTIRVLLEATLGSLAPRMKLLQDELTGGNRMVLYRDPTQQVAQFATALGAKLEAVRLWSLPMEVEFRLFNDGRFTDATVHTIQIFSPRWPLLKARLDQLRGDLDESINRYVSFRNADGLLEADGTTPIAREVQAVLNDYSTYYLALAQVDRGRPEQAADLFAQTLRTLPDPGAGRPYYYVLRWGAQSNLARLAEAAGDRTLAIRYYTVANPTGQYDGNLLRARPLIWADPFTPPAGSPGPIPAPAPPGPARPATTAAR